MIPRPSRLTRACALALALSACNEDTALPEEPPESCPLDGPSLLLAVPELATLEEGWRFTFWADAERLRYSVNANSTLATDYFQRDLCGGAPERVLAAETGLHASTVFDGPAGEVLFATDRDGNMYVADRLEVAGADVPRLLANTPRGGLIAMEHDRAGLIFNQQHYDGKPLPRIHAAGVGATTSTLWVHTGDPEADIELLVDDVVASSPTIEGEPGRIVHTDDGRLGFFDPRTLAEEPVLTGVRWFRRYWSGERAFILYQAIGDGQQEPVYLFDLATRERQQLSVNPDAAVSFGLDAEHPSTGEWTVAGVFGRLGPDLTIVEAFDKETLAPITVPEHVRVRGIGAVDLLGLQLPDPSDHVLALWDPATGKLTEWYRGPDPGDDLRRATLRDGVVRYRLKNPDDTERLVEVDLATGEPRVLLDHLGWEIAELADGRLVHSLAVDDRHNQVLVSDPATGTSRVLVDRAGATQIVQSLDLLLYTDDEAETPGVWATPLPAP